MAKRRHAGTTIDTDDDARLAFAAANDPQAFVELYERHVVAVYRYCRSRVGDRQIAEDATSEVFLKALERIGQFRGGIFAAWLIVIARNTVADTVRRRWPSIAISEGPEPIDESPSPEDRALASAERAVLGGAIAQLSEGQRTVLELQLAGWRGSEIAEALGKSNDAVKMLRFRALRRLRILLAEEVSPSAQERPDG